ncbi:MAG: class I SAM-dependent methyltransferase [Anaerolineae bacterium]
MARGTERLEGFRERYLAGDVPWDHEDPPPEVLEFVAAPFPADVAGSPPGRALDLGCGFGRASLLMGRAGWHVDGVDFVAEAVAEATRRAEAEGLRDVHFHHGSVTDLAFLEPPYDVALDVGTMHSLTDDGLAAYRDELLRLLRRGARYLLFAHLQDGYEENEGGRRWLPREMLENLFADGFRLDRREHGTTQVGDKPPWPSAWSWYTRV